MKERIFILWHMTHTTSILWSDISPEEKVLLADLALASEEWRSWVNHSDLAFFWLTQLQISSQVWNLLTLNIETPSSIVVARVKLQVLDQAGIDFPLQRGPYLFMQAETFDGFTDSGEVY